MKKFKNKVPLKFFEKLVEEMNLPMDFEKLKHI
ncbi:hypothetical protein LMOh7858_pLM80_0064 [Listeria monocytogenes str. 4b H7858]|nr:hypothetical protein [Listeria monocytogenes]EAL09793.1 hypothetical protein LMOh7858_pLM80_0064 [Listeria monocytogenes str. 4b H7858] [Listeria monocytogenes serotype 4b str. H7858]